MTIVVRARWYLALAGGVALASWFARPCPDREAGEAGVSPRIAIAIDCAASRRACELAESIALDVWSDDRGPDLPLAVVVDRDGLDRLAAAGVGWSVIDPDIDASARAERDRLRAPTAAAQADWFAEYHDYRAITTHMEELAALAPDRVSMHGIGSTLEGRSMWALRIGPPANAAAAAATPPMLPMLIDGTQHAREWIAAAVTTCVADRLVRDYDRDPAIRAFVDRTALWVIPVVNPDGYQYTWSTDRFWRKNRRGGYGVDLNRNFSVGWGGAGSSKSERSDIYRGEFAFSENESAAVRDLAKREHVAAHVDFHAFGQLVLYPWSYTASPAKDRDRFAATGDRIASALYAQHDVRYRLMQGIELYPAAGTMSDWMYGEVGAATYIIELRPKWGGGFVLPPEQIRPTCDEGLAAVLALRASLP